MPDYIIMTTRLRPGQGQMFKAEAKSLRPRPRPKFRDHFGLEDLTSLETSKSRFKTVPGHCDMRPFRIKDYILTQFRIYVYVT